MMKGRMMISATATQNPEAAIVYATCPSVEVAEEIGGKLVDDGLVACVNILPGMTSIYRWKGERQRDSEVVTVLKTRASLAGRVIEALQALHPYDNPALLVLPVAGGAAPFLAWLGEQTAAAR